MTLKHGSHVEAFPSQRDRLLVLFVLGLLLQQTSGSLLRHNEVGHHSPPEVLPK